jgi:hypothetical protein
MTHVPLWYAKKYRIEKEQEHSSYKHKPTPREIQIHDDDGDVDCFRRRCRRNGPVVEISHFSLDWSIF